MLKLASRFPFLLLSLLLKLFYFLDYKLVLTIADLISISKKTPRFWTFVKKTSKT